VTQYLKAIVAALIAGQSSIVIALGRFAGSKPKAAIASRTATSGQPTIS
jgi:hypothetical protein